MNSNALITQRDISFVSEHISSSSLTSPTSHDGILVEKLLTDRGTLSEKITIAGQAMFDAYAQNSDVARHLGFYRAQCSPGSKDHHAGTVEHSLQRLDSELWSSFVNSAQMVSVLPTKSLEEFKKRIESRDVPPFTAEHVLPTIKTWFESQYQFIAERVDGLFRALSKDHVTNSPAAFGKKMILANATGIKSNSSVASYIDDLRIVIASIQGRSSWIEGGGGSSTSTTKNGLSTSKVLDKLYAKRQFDVDFELDGGAIVLRIFKVGTVHLYIHPDVAFKLNDILAMLYPTAIPSKFRKAPAVRDRMFKEKISHALPVSLLSPVIRALNSSYSKRHDFSDYEFWASIKDEVKDNSYIFSIKKDTQQHPMFQDLMLALGAYPLSCVRSEVVLYAVNYDPREVSFVLAQSGMIPDKKDHQFYASVGKIAEDAAKWLLESHCDGLHYLEPSAGQADLVKLIPKGAKITAVEISEFNAAIARHVASATYHVADFAEFAKENIEKRAFFDRILMNPPYNNGQAQYHTRLAVELLAEGGELVAILPTSMIDDEFENCTAQRSDVYRNAFSDANVSVFILKLTKHKDK